MSKYIKSYRQLFEADTSAIRNPSTWKHLNPEITIKFGEIHDLHKADVAYETTCKLNDFMVWIHQGMPDWWNDRNGFIHQELKPRYLRNERHTKEEMKQILREDFKPMMNDTIVISMIPELNHNIFQFEAGDRQWQYKLNFGKSENIKLPKWMTIITRVWDVIIERPKEKYEIDNDRRNGIPSKDGETVKQRYHVKVYPWVSAFDTNEIMHYRVEATGVRYGEHPGTLRSRLYDKDFATFDEALNTFLDDWEVFNFMDQF